MTSKRGKEHSHGLSPDNKRMKCGFGYSLSDRIWVLKNFDFIQGSTVETDYILNTYHKEHTENNTSQQLSRHSLGKIIKDLWLGDVYPARRQKHIFGGNSFYQNLRRKDLSMNATTSDYEFVPSNLELPGNWSKVVNSVKSVSFIRAENWSINHQRVITELKVTKVDDKAIFELSTQGTVINVDETNLGRELSCIPIIQKVHLIIRFLENKTIGICSGVPLEVSLDDFTLSAVCRVVEIHDIGQVQSTVKGKVQIIYSQKCSLLCPPGQCCLSCSQLKFQQKLRISMKEVNDGTHKCCNDRWLTQQQLKEKMTNLRKELKSTSVREAYIKEKFQEEVLRMDENDSDDLKSIMKSVDRKDVPPDMEILWDQQKKILQTENKHGYRWHPKIIALCLDLYCKNPHVLDALREVMYLPSSKTIRLHKNKTEERPGWHAETVNWCLQKAMEQNFKGTDFWGGLVIDEMKIQENVEMSIKKNKDGVTEHRLVGFTQLGILHDDMRTLEGKTDPELASHVLQFMYLSDCGFRFPVAQFPSRDLTPTDLYDLFWKGVLMMLEHKFEIYWCILDGADVNRNFIQLHFPNRDPIKHNFTCMNIHTGAPMVFVMDPKHNIKKIRNNIEKSNKTGKPRCLIVGGRKIMWSQFIDAYKHDQTMTSIHIHERLTEQHFTLDPASKMRNQLAEDVLDNKMLYLMKAYRRHLITSRGDGSELDLCIQLLEHTSKLIELFSTSRNSITSEMDLRLRHLDSFLSWMIEWEKSCVDGKQFVSKKLWFDLQSMIFGFKAIVRIKLGLFPNSVIKPWITNQDVVENHFCNVRACNGQNNNPTFKLQASTQNSIRIGQKTISKKCNARCR